MTLAQISLAVALLQAAAPALIRGRVIDDAGAPIANARVTVISEALGAAIVLTDDDGRFELRVASANAEHLSITKTGYGRREVSVAAAEHDLTVRLERGAAVSGRVLDAAGETLSAAVRRARSLWVLLS